MIRKERRDAPGLSPVFRRVGMPPAKRPASCDAGSFPAGTGAEAGAEGGRGAVLALALLVAAAPPPAAATRGADLSLTWAFLRPLPSATG